MSSNSSSSTQALVARAPRAALFIPDLEISPPLSVYRHHAAITYQQLLEACSGATSQPADSPRACMPRAAWSWSESGQERLRVRSPSLLSLNLYFCSLESSWVMPAGCMASTRSGHLAAMMQPVLVAAAAESAPQWFQYVLSST